MPQISHNESVKVNNKTCKKRTASSKKNSTCMTLADKQRRQVNWQRQGHHPQTKRQAQTAETASATKKITMLMLVKYLEKRGRSVWSRGIFDMRSHLIPQSMWHPHYFKMSLTRALWKSKNLVTSRIHLPSNDAPHQWNLGKLYQSQVWLKIILYCTEMI